MNNLFGKTLRSLMDGAEVKERALAEALDSDQRFYTDSLLDIIGGLDYIEMSILAGSAGLPEILIINDVFCMQLLWNTGGETAAVFSSDREVVAEFARVQGRCLSGRRLCSSTPSPCTSRTPGQTPTATSTSPWIPGCGRRFRSALSGCCASPTAPS